MLHGERRSGFTRSKSSHGGVPADLILASDSSVCFQCKLGLTLVLRRPMETTFVRVNRSIFGMRVEIARQDQLQSYFVRRTGETKTDASFDVQGFGVAVEDREEFLLAD
jgi:hypothetical protein